MGFPTDTEPLEVIRRTLSSCLDILQAMATMSTGGGPEPVHLLTSKQALDLRQKLEHCQGGLDSYLSRTRLKLEPDVVLSEEEDDLFVRISARKVPAAKRRTKPPKQPKKKRLKVKPEPPSGDAFEFVSVDKKERYVGQMGKTDLDLQIDAEVHRLEGGNDDDAAVPDAIDDDDQAARHRLKSLIRTMCTWAKDKAIPRGHDVLQGLPVSSYGLKAGSGYKGVVMLLALESPVFYQRSNALEFFSEYLDISQTLLRQQISRTYKLFSLGATEAAARKLKVGGLTRVAQEIKERGFGGFNPFHRGGSVVRGTVQFGHQGHIRPLHGHT